MALVEKSNLDKKPVGRITIMLRRFAGLSHADKLKRLQECWKSWDVDVQNVAIRAIHILGLKPEWDNLTEWIPEDANTDYLASDREKAIAAYAKKQAALDLDPALKAILSELKDSLGAEPEQPSSPASAFIDSPVIQDGKIIIDDPEYAIGDLSKVTDKETIDAVIYDSNHKVKQEIIAEKYGIELSEVKRIVKEHRAKK